LIAIGPGAFPVATPIITFDGVVLGTDVNGLVVGGASFRTTLGGVATNGLAIISIGGPGDTNNITPPMILSNGNQSNEALVVELPTLSDRFGFGYAILATDPVADAVTVELFNGLTSVGSLSFAGVQDPVFTGGFAGVQSTLAFNRARLTFSNQAAAYAVDNVRFTAATPVAVPEPSTLALASVGVMAGLVTLSRRARRRHAS
jgi:hypothetical protein